LKQIARDGRVYTLTPNFKPAFKIEKKSDPLEIRSIPISKASTFLGYCEDHDRDLFFPLECEKLGENKPVQSTLVMLRAISYEFALKREMKMFNDKLRDMLDIPYFDPSSIDLANEFWANGYGNSLLSEIFRIIKENDWGKIRSRWFRISKKIDVSACGLKQIGYDDYYGEDETYNSIPMMAFYLVPQENETFLILSYFEEHSLLANKELGVLNDNNSFSYFLNKLIFSDCEDSCYGPNFWESLSKEEQKQICLSIRHPNHREFDFEFPRFINLSQNEVIELN